MDGFVNGASYAMVLISPENLAGYLVTAFFTIINLLVTYVIIRRFLFKPAISFMKKRREAVAAELENAKTKKKEADELLSEARIRIEKSTHEATNIVEDAKTQAEMQSGAILETSRREAIEIVARGHDDVERMKKAAVEDMRDEVADLSIAIAYKIVSQSIDEKRQRELVEQFIGEELDGKGEANG
ncbi:MAG: F0F1 ATP synthase subunit B [Saccharofermentanales bacterium]